jgi:hypothetical protein
MEPKTKQVTSKNELFQDERYHYTYIIKNGEKVKFYGDDEIKKEFDIHHYGECGTLYYRKQ